MDISRAFLLLLLIIFTAFKVSGSSVGMFYKQLYGEKAQDPHLIAGTPRAIRSDEWEIVTPLTVAQTNSGMHTINQDVGEQQDMSVVMDVPYKDWSSLFKPQNWVFFILPVEYAFAFKWWLLGVLLMLSCYVLSLKLIHGKILLAALISICLFLSPFIQWWYQTVTLAPVFYCLFIIAIVICLFEPKITRARRLLLATALWYMAACALMVLYLPFLVSCFGVAGAYVTGHILNRYRIKRDRKTIHQSLLFAGIAILLATSITGIFLVSHRSTLQTISSTVYPGKRTEQSGGMDIRQLLGGTFNSQLQSDTKAKFLPANLNQSEASNFILIFPFLIPVALYILRRSPKDTFGLDWRLAGLLGIAAVYSLRLFVRQSDFIFRALQLDRIPHNRLLIGFGLINLLFVLVIMQRLALDNVKISRKIILASSLFGFFITTLVGLSMKRSYVGYLHSSFKILLVGLIIGSVVYLILQRKFVAGAVVLLLFSAFSSLGVNPLQRGLFPIVGSEISQSIKTTGDKEGKWVVTADIATYENVTIGNGLQSLSGVYSYPQLKLWEPLKFRSSDEDVYNRYAHVFFSIEPIDTNQQGAFLDPPALDAFRVHADPCDAFAKTSDIAYVLTSEKKEDLACLKLLDTVSYPAVNFYTYSVEN